MGRFLQDGDLTLKILHQCQRRISALHEVRLVAQARPEDPELGLRDFQRRTLLVFPDVSIAEVATVPTVQDLQRPSSSSSAAEHPLQAIDRSLLEVEPCVATVGVGRGDLEHVFNSVPVPPHPIDFGLRLSGAGFEMSEGGPDALDLGGLLFLPSMLIGDPGLMTFEILPMPTPVFLE